METSRNETQPRHAGWWQTSWFIIMATLLSFGGGNAVFPFIKKQAVERRQWISEQEFDDLFLITNMIPGPSVIESLSYVAIKRHGRLWGTLITILALLPHLALFMALYVVSDRFFPRSYLYVINVGVLPVIIASLLLLCVRYFKQSKKELGLTWAVIIAVGTIVFSLFIPTPYNVAAIVLAVLLIVSSLIVFFSRRKHKKEQP